MIAEILLELVQRLRTDVPQVLDVVLFRENSIDVVREYLGRNLHRRSLSDSTMSYTARI